MESDNSANAGSNDSSGNSEALLAPPKACPSLSDVRELERNGVVGRDEARWRDVDRLVPVLSIAGELEIVTGREGGIPRL